MATSKAEEVGTAAQQNVDQLHSVPGSERQNNNGHSDSGEGWHSVYDSVMSQPPDNVIDAVVGRCSAEWYRIGAKLGHNDSKLRAITFNIPTPEGKLQAIIESKSEELGTNDVVKALLDVCELVMPLTVVAVMQDLGIQYPGTVSDHLLYEVGREIGRDWKMVARRLGLTVHDMADIKMKARSSRKRAWKMLRLWYTKIRNCFKADKIHETLQRIRKTEQDQKSPIFPANVHFDQRVCGRQKELEGIAREFWGETTDKETPTGIPKYCLQVVNGTGGIGKTAISEKYAVEWRKKYADGVFHFNAESLASLHISIRNNLSKLSMESGGHGVFNDNEIFLKYVNDTGRVLLLYDGADDLNLLENILPGETSHVHVLVTTRMGGDHPILGRANQVTELHPLGVDAGVEALQAWRGHADEKIDGEELVFARRLVHDSPIAGLPLAIAHIATCIRLGRMKYKQYYELFKKEQTVLQALALDMDKLLHYFRIGNLKEPLMLQGISSPNDLKRLSIEDIEAITTDSNGRRLLSMATYFILNSNHVHLTWQLDIETVNNADKNAMNLLCYVSLMSCRNIPERVVRPLLFSDMFAYQYPICASTLRSHSLVDVSENNEGCRLDMHPLVQSTVLERVMRVPEELHQRLTRMSHRLLSLLPLDDENIQCHMRDNNMLSLIPHLYAVAKKAVWIHDDQICDSLVDTACQIAYLFRHIDTSVYLCHERLKGVSINNFQRVQAHFEMGRSYELMANLPLAQTHFTEALQFIESSSDYDKARMEFYYLRVLGKLGICYQKQQMYAEAQHMYQTLLSLWRDRPGDNRRDIAFVSNNLALIYQNSGQIQKAMKTYKEVLEVMRGDSEVPAISLATVLVNLGHCLMDDGQFEMALPILEEGLMKTRESVPEKHIDLAVALTKLSSCCLELNDLQRAMNLSEQSVAIATDCLPKGHPRITEFLSRLAACHQRAGYLDQAMHLLQQCAEILREGLPSTREDFCTTLNNIGQAYVEKGMSAEAISVLEECLAFQYSFLRADHPVIGTALWNLGAAYKAQNDVMKATEVWKQCLSVREKCLPSTHPGLLDVLTKLCGISFKQEQYEECLQLCQRSHDILMTVSPVTRDTATVCCNMGVCYAKLRHFDAAEEAFRQALSIYTIILPQGHAEISKSWTNVDTVIMNNYQSSFVVLIAEQAIHQVWQWKFEQW